MGPDVTVDEDVSHNDSIEEVADQKVCQVCLALGTRRRFSVASVVMLVVSVRESARSRAGRNTR